MTITHTLIHLQHYGMCTAKPASELKVGDITIWNTGATAEVIAITEASKHFLNVTTRYATSRGRYEEGVRRLKKDRLVAYR
ncbi:MAG: hypothetical protein EOP83_11470, partial [Verrucomicrobiaceae bacterium]